MVSNTGVIFAAVPESPLPVVGEHLKVVKRTIDLDAVELADGDILLRNLYLAMDPYMRGRMQPPDYKSYNLPPFQLGHVIIGLGVSEVVRSQNNPKFKVGDVVSGATGWEEYSRIPAKYLTETCVIPDARTAGIPLSYHCGIFGMTGLTAYASLEKIAKPKPGETIFVSAASGAVGQVVCQIAKLKGLHVVGCAGSEEKKRFLLDELKVDDAFNYKTVDTDKALSDLCQNGIDIYYDNVGGQILDTALTHLKHFARVVCCGMISQYGLAEPYAIKNLRVIVSRRVLIQGFIITDFGPEYQDEFDRNMREWYRAGKLKCKEYIQVGIEKTGETFVEMLTGKNFGRTVVEVAQL